MILFGSAARGELTHDSDLDFLVIERDVENRVAEAVRLRDAVGRIGWPVDVIVMDEDLAERRAKVRGAMSITPSGRVGSLPAPSPEQREYADLLLEQATSDLGACRVLMAAKDMRDDVVGFHAQQAVEKALKVALVLADVDFSPLS